MGLEAATYIQDLVTTNPTSGDQKSQGDDHLRLIKAVLKNTFPSATGPLSFGNYATKNGNFLSKNADYTQLAGDNGKSIFFDCSGGPHVYNLTAAATAADGFMVYISKDGTANALTIDPAGSELINGAATLVLGPNAFGLLICSGTAWRFFGNGTVQGIASSTDGALVLFNGTTGNVIKLGPAPGANGNILQSNGTVWASVAAPAAGPSAASQAELEAESAVSKYIPPNLAKHLPWAIKAAVNWRGSDGAVQRGYNTTGVTRLGTGLYTWTINQDLSASNFIILTGIWATGINDPCGINIEAVAVGSIDFSVRARSGGVIDPPNAYAAVIGDFA